MAAHVVFHRLAAQEYRKALAWYRRRSATAAARFRTQVGIALEKILVSPEVGTVFREYRWIRTRRFPYLIFYDADDPTVIRVYAVAHGRRRLGYWLRRPKRP
jgi:plasmid stabilization system protein ParE